MGLGRNYFTQGFKSNSNPTSATNNSISVLTHGADSATFTDFGINSFNPYTQCVSPPTIGAQNIGFLSANSNEKVYKKGMFSKFVL